MKRYKRYDELPFEMLHSLSCKVNSKPLWGRPPGTVRMIWSATRMLDVFEQQYWDVYFHITFEPATFKVFPMPEDADGAVAMLTKNIFGEADLTPIEDSVEVNG